MSNTKDPGDRYPALPDALNAGENLAVDILVDNGRHHSDRECLAAALVLELRELRVWVEAIAGHTAH